MEERVINLNFLCVSIWSRSVTLKPYYQKPAVAELSMVDNQNKMSIKTEVYFSNMNKTYSITALNLQLRLKTVKMTF